MPTRHQLGKYWLWARDSRKTSGQGQRKRLWYIAWYERNPHTGKRVTRRKSTGIECAGVEPPEAVLQALSEFYLEKLQPERKAPAEAYVADITAAYFQQHGKHQASAEQIRISLRHFLQFLQIKASEGVISGAARIEDLTPQLIEDFQQWRSGPHGYTYERKGRQISFSHSGVGWDAIGRNLDDLRSALSWARKRHMITEAPYIENVAAEKKAGPRERILSPEEAAGVLEAAYRLYENWRSPATWYFCMIGLATAGRPEAIIDMHTSWAIDKQLWLLRFNAPGRAQTKKLRPTIPIPRVLMPWLEPLNGWVISKGEGGQKEPRYGAKRVLSVKKQMAAIYEGLGIEDASPVTLRYTMSAVLRQKGVAEWEADGFTGHASQSTTGRHYARYRPDFYSDAREAVDSYFQDIERLTTVHLRFPRDSRLPEPKVVPLRK